MAETIYFDTCALNRLTDSATSERVRLETDAVIRLLDGIATSRLQWVASTVLRLELERNSDPIRRRDALEVLSSAYVLAVPAPKTLRRAQLLAGQGLRGMDSLHLAPAEQENVEWLVTTDDRFLKLGNRLATVPLQIINPVDLVRRRFPWLLQKP